MLNHIELAKECGAMYEAATPFSTETITFFDDELTAYTNAIIEMCAKVADDRQKQVGDSTNEFSILAAKIRELKVKG